MAGEFTAGLEELLPPPPQDSDGNPELGVTWVMSEGCRILQVVKVNVEFVHDRHFPGFAVATETETFRKPNTEKKDEVNNTKGPSLFC